MHTTHNDLALATRKKVNAVLLPLLADASDLYSQLKQAHWNVRGAGFVAVHELFDAVAAEVSGAVDEIAERIMQLGGEAPGTVRASAKTSRLKEYPHLRAEVGKHIEAVAKVLAAFNAFARKAIDETDAAGDAITADLLTQITGKLDKQLWFVEAHVSAK